MDVEECNGIIETLEKEIVDLRKTVRKARLDVSRGLSFSFLVSCFLFVVFKLVYSCSHL